MNRTLHDRTVALAGVFQSALLTQQLARRGRADPAAFSASVNSLFMIDAGTTEEVFGGAGGVASGLRFLSERLAAAAEPADMEVARYVISLMQLERSLERRADMQGAVRDGIRAIESRTPPPEGESEEEPVAPAVVEQLAELYSKSLSTLSPRIMVNGEQGNLANARIAAKVRAALFAGIRAAFLWRQLGGRRWQLLFLRRRIAAEAAGILRGRPG